MIDGIFFYHLFYLSSLTENDVEENPLYDRMNSMHNNQPTGIESNVPQRYSLAIRSNLITNPATTTATAASSVVAKPEIITTDPITLSVLSADIENIVQHALDSWKNEARPMNDQTNINQTLPFNNEEEDFLLADLLQRTENEQQNLLLRPLGMQLFVYQGEFCFLFDH